MLLERDRELAVLTALVADLDSTGGKVVLIRGEAGIGKSSLVRQFVDLDGAAMHVHYGACDDLVIQQPLGPFWDMARSEPSLRGPVYDGDRPRVLEAVLDLLSRSLRPTLIIIEDTHWADAASLDAIKYIGRRIARTNGLFLLTYRDGEVDYDHPLRTVIGDLPTQNVVRMHLRALSLAAVSQMVVNTDLDPMEVFEATGGNPFLVTEMASVTGDAVPPSLEDAVMARVRRLSIGAHEMLKTLSVIPEPIPTSDALGLPGVDDTRLEECTQRGFLQIEQGFFGWAPRAPQGLVMFRHDLIRRAVESALSSTERLAKHRVVLAGLPEKTHPCLLIHCAVEAGDIDRLIDLAPRSARYAAAAGSHVQAVEDFREVEPHLDRFTPDELGRLLDEWAEEEFLVDNVTKAIELNENAISHYRQRGDRRSQSRALGRGAHFHENAGHRDLAEERARGAVEVLGTDAAGADLAEALEANAYLQWMAGNFEMVPELVRQTLEAGGPQIDERIRIRSLSHLGVAGNIADYPRGRARLDEAAERAEAAGQWFEECRALLLHAWAAGEARDLPIALDYSRRAIASAVRHELRFLEAYSRAIHARVLDLAGKWNEAEDVARELLDTAAITQMVALPILGVMEARRGRAGARSLLLRAWELAAVAAEDQRLTPAAAALAEYGWITGDADLPLSRLRAVMTVSLEKGFSYSPGAIAFWLWKLGELAEPPEGIAEPYRLVIEGDAHDAAAIWDEKGVPYERALALMHGDRASQLEALDLFEALGATAIAGRLRASLREQGVTVPRGKGKHTRTHAAGLTARQAEVLQLLGEGLANVEIADELFVSPRTVENHVSAILTKLDAATRTEAVARARSAGLLASVP